MSKRDKIELKELESLPEALDGNHRVIPIVTGEDDTVEEVAVPEILPVLTLRSSVLFPGAITPVTVGRSRSMTLVRDTNARNGMLAAVLQRDGDVEEPKAEDMYRIGTAARIMKILEMPNGNLTVILNGLEKVEIGEYVSSDPYLQARVTPLKDSTPDEKNVEFNALVDSIRDVALNIINISPNMPKEAIFAIKNIDSKRGIINFICSNMELTDEDRQSLLEAPGLLARARKLLEILIREQQLAELKSQIQERVKQEIDKQQRDYYLQQQMRTIQDELGDGADADIEKMREEAKKKNWPKEVGETFEKELQKVKIEDEVTDVVCDQCGRNMVVKYGPHGKFLACPGFPECRNTKPYLEKIGVPCPKCGKDVVLRKTKKGRKYFGCENNPECDFMSWSRPVAEKCPKCGGYMVVKGNKIACADAGCGYTRDRKADEDTK